MRRGNGAPLGEPHVLHGLTSNFSLCTRSLRVTLAGCLVLLASIDALAIAASLAHIRMGQTTALGIVAASIGIALFFARVCRGDAADDHELAISEAPVDPATQRSMRRVAAATLGFYVILWVLALASRDTSCDGNAYHLPPLNMWSRHGGIYWIDAPWSTLWNGYPKGLETLSWVLATATGSSRATNAITVLTLPVGYLSILLLSRLLGATPLACLIAGGLLLLIPVEVQQTPTTYVDAGFGNVTMAFFALCAVAATLTARRALDARVALTHGIPLGAAAGLMLGGKASAVALVPIGLAMVVIARVWARRGKLARELTAAGSLVFVAVAIGLLVAGYWYIRNYRHAGSPLYPVGVRVLGHTVFPGISAAEAMNGAANTPPELAGRPDGIAVLYTWAQGLWRWPRSIGGVDSRLGGLGFLWLCGALPAVAWMLRARGGAARTPTLWFLLVAVGCAFIATPMHWWARYTVWIYALGLPAFAAASASAWDFRANASRGAQFMRAIVVVALVEGVAALCIAIVHGSFGWRAGYLFPETRGTALEEVLRSDEAVAVPSFTTTSVGGREKHNVYGELSLPLGRRDMVQVDPIGSGALPNVHYVVLDDASPLPPTIARASLHVEHVPGFWVVRIR